ncbi:MAG: DUF1559 domain-containing protein, partial [Isosphaeraceae bacterium]
MTTRVSSHRGVSLLEILVVVVIIGLIVLLTLPAIQGAREMARRGQCLNNLRQIGIGIHAYIGTYQCFPQAHNGKGYSPLVVILPFLDQKRVYDSINFNLPYPPTVSIEHLTASRLALAVFMCPSDGQQLSAGSTNYAGNRGVGYTETSHANNGLFTHPLYASPVGLQGIADGSSNTAAYSEWLIGSNGRSSRDAKRVVYSTNTSYARSDQLSEFVRACKGVDVAQAESVGPGKGREWMHGDFISTLYNHAIIPNGHSCTNGGLV